MNVAYMATVRAAVSRPSAPGVIISHMGMPRKQAVEITPERVYFIDNRNERWRLYDTTYGPPHNAPFKRSAYRPPNPIATSRVFVKADGERWEYRFQSGDDRSLDVENLGRQRSAASFAPGGPRFDGSKHYVPGR
jgi:hypothetical protein